MKGHVHLNCQIVDSVVNHWKHHSIEQPHFCATTLQQNPKIYFLCDNPAAPDAAFRNMPRNVTACDNTLQDLSLGISVLVYFIPYSIKICHLHQEFPIRQTSDISQITHWCCWYTQKKATLGRTAAVPWQVSKKVDTKISQKHTYCCWILYFVFIFRCRDSSSETCIFLIYWVLHNDNCFPFILFVPETIYSGT